MYLDGPSEALPRFQRAVDLVPEYVMAQSNLGGALLALGRVEEAIVQLRKTLALRPDHPWLHRSRLAADHWYRR
jgi:protein O-GlcNAc transferase